MTTERGQRTTIRFGGVRAEVSLVKASSKPKGAQHETKRVLADPPPMLPVGGGLDPLGAAPDPLGGDPGPHTAIGRALRTEAAPDPLGDPGDGHVDVMLTTDRLTTGQAVHEDAAPDVSEAMAQRDEAKAALGEWAQARGPIPVAPDPLGEKREQAMTTGFMGTAPIVAPGGVIPEGVDATPPAVTPAGYMGERGPQTGETYTPPATTVQQGVHLPDGTWVDLTEQLREVDERTRVDGMEVVATIAQGAVLRERVRDAHYVAGVNPHEYPVLALLWHGLREADRAAAVVWTKKTAQALGFVVARGTLGEDAHLILLELEWAANMKGPGPRALGPIRAEVSGEQRAAARELVDAFAQPPSALNDLRDMRLAKRAELLDLARAGKLEAYDPPPPPREDVDVADLAAAFAASAAAVR